MTSINDITFADVIAVQDPGLSSTDVMSSDGGKDLITEARSFCGSLQNVFMMRKKRDAQTQHLLEKAKALLESLVAENQRLSSNPGTPRSSARGGMGQLWVKLDELKRENSDLRRQLGKSQDDRAPLAIAKTQGPGEVIITELHKNKSENETLRADNEKLQKNLKESKAITFSLQDEYRRYKVGLDAAQTSLEQLRRENKSVESQLNSMKTENDTLKKQVTRSNEVKTNSPKRNNVRPPKPIPPPRPDNRKCENISEKCRPSVIAMKYSTLESDQWMDAKESLEDTTEHDEEEIVRVLCSMLMNSYRSGQETYMNLLTSISHMLNRPATQICPDWDDSHPVDKQLRSLPAEMTDSIGIILRQNGDGIDVKSIIKRSVNYTSTEHPRLSDIISSQNEALARYLEVCARLTWQMVIQHPPMILSNSDTTFSDANHKLWWSCDQSRANTIHYFVWPSLLDYEGGNLLVKGCVFADS